MNLKTKEFIQSDATMNLAESKQLSILLDARKLFHGGIGVYLQNVIEAIHQKHKCTLLINPSQKELIKSRNFMWFKDVDFFETRQKVLAWGGNRSLAKKINRGGFDLFHSPYFNLPRGIKIPSVVTIHDLIQITHPERFYYPMLAKKFLTSAIKRAKLVLTVSNTSATLLKKYFSELKNKTDKLVVIPNAISDAYLEPALVEYTEARDPYLLSVFSNLKPHKALEDLIEAFNILKSKDYNGKVPSNLKLVLAGIGLEQDKFDDPDILIKTDLDLSDLASLYKAADAYVMPSLMEGFGLPVIEAHSQGTAVVARPVLAVKELLTANDIVVKDFQISSLADAMANVYQRDCGFHHPELVHSLEDFKLDSFAKKLNQVYCSLV